MLRASLLCVLTVPTALGADVNYEQQIYPLVQRYCLPCHDSVTLKGDLDLERFTTLELVQDSVAIWKRIYKRMEDRQMPPRNRPQLTDEERQLVMEWIEKLENKNVDCDQVPSDESVSWYPGYVMSRRLNRAEYENTLRDLLGVAVDVAHLFPADGAGGEGFDNNGSALFLSAIQIEKYLEAADLAIETAIPSQRTPRRSKGSTVSLVSGAANPGARPRLIPVEPSRGVTPREAARTALATFAERAWRRPIEPEEIDRLLQAFDRGYDRGDGYVESVKLAFKSALVSPHFLFLAEPEPHERGNYELGDYPLASRLSYFIWATMPDDELFALARDGALRDPNEIQRQVKRMLRDPKAAALGELFGAQWLGITQLGDTVKPDAAHFPEFDAALAEAMRAEAVAYFNHIVREDRSLIELLDAPYTFMNEPLARIYGVEGVLGEEMRRVELLDANRGGVLGMAAVLTATSHPLRTSPVLRGKWVLEQLLGDRVPPPPPNVAQLPEDGKHPEGLTLRQQLELHRKNPECASCHERMDPIGFGLENFDPIGRWRTEQGGKPVDSQGVLPSGEAFDGPRELKNILLARKDEFARHLSRKMIGYALGRSLTQYDECVIKSCFEALKASDYRPSALVTEIALSYPFRHRYSGGTTAVASES